MVWGENLDYTLDVTYNELVELALEWDDVVEVVDKGNHSVSRGGRVLFWFQTKYQCVAMKMDWDSHDEFLMEHPDVFFKNDHFRSYPALLLLPENINIDLARRAVEASWMDAPNKVKYRK